MTSRGKRSSTNQLQPWNPRNPNELEPCWKMVLYLTFPVAMFWVANQADWFEHNVIQRKRELWPPETEEQRRELEEFKDRLRKQREEKLLRAVQHSS